MATIKAKWHRSIRVRAYESELVELSVETTVDEVNDGPAVSNAAGLYAQLKKEGDKIVAEILAAGGSSDVPNISPQKPTEPDPFV
jgi:hypothetical protein